MRIRYDKGENIWVADSTFEDVDLLSGRRGGAGWRFCGGSCAAKWKCKGCAARIPAKTWWTDDPVKARRLERFMDAGALEAIAEEKKAVELSNAMDSDLDLPVPAGLAYYGYQRAGIAYALSKQNVLIADEMGLGKTIQAIGVANADDTIKNVLIVCPASLRVNWRREWERWAVRPGTICVVETATPPAAEVIAAALEQVNLAQERMQELAVAAKEREDAGRQPTKTQTRQLEAGVRRLEAKVARWERLRSWRPVAADAEVVIVNFDLVHDKRVLAALNARKWDLLVVDEAHLVKNARGAQRAKAVLGYWDKDKREKVPGLIDNARRRVFLTGTPIPNGRPVEAHPLLAALCPDQFRNWMSFVKRYCGAHKKQVSRSKEVWITTGATNLAELQEKMRQNLMVRRLKADVLKDLPPKTHQTIALPPNGATKLLDQQAAMFDLDLTDEDSFFQSLERPKVAFDEVSRVRRELAETKADAVIEHVGRALEEKAKLLVFAHHHVMIDRLEEAFRDQCVVLDGRRNAQQRQDAVDRFQEDPDVKLFIGQISAAGVGLTLTAAHDVIFAEVSWVPGDMQQAEDRAHRIGQDQVVSVQWLVYEGSIDEAMTEMLAVKRSRSDAALDNADPLADSEVDEKVAKKKRERKEAEAKCSDALRQAAHEAVRLLASMCDGAHEEDMMGFNKIDTMFGKRLAALPALTAKQALAAARMAKKYRRQLPEELLERLTS